MFKPQSSYPDRANIDLLKYPDWDSIPKYIPFKKTQYNKQIYLFKDGLIPKKPNFAHSSI